MTTEERFFKKVRKTRHCWLWTANKIGDGYGGFYFNGRQTVAHKASYIMRYGKIADPSLKVCHRCNNKLCVRPEHLYLATQKQNVRDAFRDGLVVSANSLKKKCKNGHIFNKSNTIIKKSGARGCKKCILVQSKKTSLRRRMDRWARGLRGWSPYFEADMTTKSVLEK